MNSFVLFLRALHVPFFLPLCFDTRIVGEEYKLLILIFLQIRLTSFLLFPHRLIEYISLGNLFSWKLSLFFYLVLDNVMTEIPGVRVYCDL